MISNDIRTCYNLITLKFVISTYINKLLIFDNVLSTVLGTLSNVIRLPTNSSAFELAGAKFITLNNMSVYTDGPLLKSITVQVWKCG